MGDLKTALKHALVSRFGVRSAVADDTGLFSGGLIDSLNVIELVSFVEAEIGCAVSPADITLENFDSIDRIVSYARTLTAPGHGA